MPPHQNPFASKQITVFLAPHRRSHAPLSLLAALPPTANHAGASDEKPPPVPPSQSPAFNPLITTPEKPALATLLRRCFHCILLLRSKYRIN
ncbi:hypothetical protein U1Q18_013967 [Sarracenia purpurea var. burkii]